MFTNTDIEISEFHVRRILCAHIAANIDTTNVAGDRYLTPAMIGARSVEILRAIEKTLETEDSP